jgi:TM2 domain-containing membrane protein YozV
LAILVGPLGAHKFVLGYSRAGLIMLLAPVVVIPAGWWASTVVSLLMGTIGLIEGLIYLRQTPQQFKTRYIDAKKEWF